MNQYGRHLVIYSHNGMLLETIDMLSFYDVQYAAATPSNILLIRSSYSGSYVSEVQKGGLMDTLHSYGSYSNWYYDLAMDRSGSGLLFVADDARGVALLDKQLNLVSTQIIPNPPTTGYSPRRVSFDAVTGTLLVADLYIVNVYNFQVVTSILTTTTIL